MSIHFWLLLQNFGIKDFPTRGDPKVFIHATADNTLDGLPNQFVSPFWTCAIVFKHLLLDGMLGVASLIAQQPRMFDAAQNIIPFHMRICGRGENLNFSASYFYKNKPCGTQKEDACRSYSGAHLFCARKLWSGVSGDNNKRTRVTSAKNQEIRLVGLLTFPVTK